MDNQPPFGTQQPQQQNTTNLDIKKGDSTFNLLTFIPVTGIFGFHDLYVKNYKNFALHMFISIVAMVLNIVVPKIVANHLFSISTKGYITMPSDPVYTFFCTVLPTIIFIGLYIWGIIENRHLTKTQVVPKQEAIEQQTNINSKINNRNFSAISFFLSLIPVLIWLYTLITVIQHIDQIKAPGFSGGVAIIWLPLFYYGAFGVGFVVSFFSIKFAIKGLKIKKQKPLAIASLVLKGVTAALIIATFIMPKLLP